MRRLGRRDAKGKSNRRDRESEPLEIAKVLDYYGANNLNKDFCGWSKKFCCPFHGERVPSAVYSEEFGSFKCFACDYAGDALTIIMKAENCDFLNSVRKYEEITGKKPSGIRDSTSRESGGEVPTEPRDYEANSGFLFSRIRRGTH